MPERKKLWGWKQIANHIGVSEPTAKKYLEEKKLPVYKPAGRYFAFAEELDEWARVNGSTEQQPQDSGPRHQTSENIAKRPQGTRRRRQLIAGVAAAILIATLFLQHATHVPVLTTVLFENGTLQAMDANQTSRKLHNRLKTNALSIEVVSFHG